jgi:hypothetical protein
MRKKFTGTYMKFLNVKAHNLHTTTFFDVARCVVVGHLRQDRPSTKLQHFTKQETLHRQCNEVLKFHTHNAYSYHILLVM